MSLSLLMLQVNHTSVHVLSYTACVVPCLVSDSSQDCWWDMSDMVLSLHRHAGNTTWTTRKVAFFCREPGPKIGLYVLVYSVCCFYAFSADINEKHIKWKCLQSCNCFWWEFCLCSCLNWCMWFVCKSLYGDHNTYYRAIAHQDGS